MPLAVVVIVIVSVLASFAYFPYRKGEVGKATSIALPSDGVVRVLQLTDLHLISTDTKKEDKQTLKWVEEAIEYAKPDIVAVMPTACNRDTNSPCCFGGDIRGKADILDADFRQSRRRVVIRVGR